jgi:predicted CXXCH cytochrome family protein
MLVKFGAAALSIGVFMVMGGGGQTGPAPGAGYAWAASCQKCHPAEYESWAKTKHATALERLSSAEQDKECIGCHVTGAKVKVLEDGKVLNRGVQCEACHGAAASHVADPKVKTTLKPAAPLCEECHSDKGPHFKGFWYDAMKGLVHSKK